MASRLNKNNFSYKDINEEMMQIANGAYRGYQTGPGWRWRLPHMRDRTDGPRLRGAALRQNPWALIKKHYARQFLMAPAAGTDDVPGGVSI